MTVKHHLILIGCVKTKNKDLFGEDSKPNQAARCTPAELYASQLFKFRRLHAEERGLPWAVLSAKYGIWWPATLNRPYDQTFADMNEAERLAWHSSVCHLLVEQLWEPFNLKQADGPIKASDLTIEFHAGADYCHPVAEMLQALGINVLLPMAGLQIGEQLAWYSETRREAGSAGQPAQQKRSVVGAKNVAGKGSPIAVEAST